MKLPKVKIQLPDWVEPFLAEADDVFPSDEDKMGLVMELARQNVQRKTGGPFGAAVFDHEGRLIAPGVNVVTTAKSSVLHAEIVALILAQNILDRYDLGDGGRLHYALAASAEPCAMCLGAVPWSGISRLICGARDEDVRAFGFEEGSKPPNWIAELQTRGIEVVRDQLREKAVAVLHDYASAGGLIYNPGQ